MKLRIVVCDDEQIFTEDLSKRLTLEFLKYQVKLDLVTFNHSLKAVEYIKGHEVDAVFLDLEMPDLNGLEATEEIQRTKPIMVIIFITNHDEMVFDTPAYQPFWFLRKSHLDDLTKVVDRLIKKIKRENRIYPLIIGKEMTNVNIDDIIYFESANHYVKIYMRDGTKSFKANLADVEKHLELFDFIRVHVGYLVNAYHIKTIRKNKIALDNGEELQISRNYVKSASEKFLEYMRCLR